MTDYDPRSGEESKYIPAGECLSCGIWFWVLGTSRVKSFGDSCPHCGSRLHKAEVVREER